MKTTTSNKKINVQGFTFFKNKEDAIKAVADQGFIEKSKFCALTEELTCQNGYSWFFASVEIHNGKNGGYYCIVHAKEEPPTLKTASKDFRWKNCKWMHESRMCDGDNSVIDENHYKVAV